MSFPGALIKGIVCGIMIATGLFAQSPEGGMWMPTQMEKMDRETLGSLGLELSPDVLYHPEKASLTDAVVSFGGFCSGAFISGQGLLLTNHHCAYAAIESHNTRGRNLLEDGFWALRQEDELANPGLEVSVLVRMEDVTGAMVGTIRENGSHEHRAKAIESRKRLLEQRYAAETGLRAEVRSANSGNSWHLYLYRTFRDVRLVAAPPLSIARFGGDGAGRSWPMHTADFALFRVYADTSNAPAHYSLDNRPYRPENFCAISLEGVKENDFTLVAGFPGESSLSLSSYGLRERLELYNPAMIRLRETILSTLLPDMEKSRQLRSKYGSMYSSIHNAHASLQGEMTGLYKLDAIGVRLKEEIDLARWIAGSTRNEKLYGDLLTELRLTYLRRERLLGMGLHLEATMTWIGLLDLANQWRNLGDLDPKKTDARSFAIRAEQLKRDTRAHFRMYSAPTDEKLCAALLALLHEHLPPSHRPEVFPDLERRFKGDLNTYTAHIYRRSILVSGANALDFLRNFRPSQLSKLKRDPGYALMDRLVTYYNAHYYLGWQAAELALTTLQGRYQAALDEREQGRLRAPDANGSLRFSLGKVAAYQPEEGMWYRFFTSSEGILENHRSGDENYRLPERFVRLLESGKFGRYGSEGFLPVNFLATNHTTNGNSGSPVLDGKGRLIGLNSARTLESAVSDFIYDPAEIRNVSVDIRYVVFIVDRYAGARRLVEEMVRAGD